MQRKVYTPQDFNEWTAVDRRGIMALPGSPSVSDWLEGEVKEGRISERVYPLISRFKMYDNHSRCIYRNIRLENDKQIDICQWCGRLEPCQNNWGSMFCVDTPTCNAYYAMATGRYSLRYNLTKEHQWSIDLLKQCNLTRLPDMWREWAERQIAINDYHKGEL